jgi:hypothetical protein
MKQNEIDEDTIKEMVKMEKLEVLFMEAALSILVVLVTLLPRILKMILTKERG